MPRNGSGTYLWPANSWNPAVDNTDVDASDWNDGLADLETAVSDSISSDGQTTISANIPMSNFKLTGLGDGTALTDAINLGQLQKSVFAYAAAAGTADIITAAFTPAVTALTDGILLRVKASAANATTTPNFQADSTTAHTITKLGGQTLAIGDIFGAGHDLLLEYSATGTRWELLNPANPKITADLPMGGFKATGLANGTVATDAAAFGQLATQAATFTGFLSGLTLSAAGSTGTFGVAAGVAVNSTSALLMSLASAFTKTTGAFVAGTGNGSLDTGAIANTTWYHVYLISTAAGATDILTSLSPTAPTLPATYTLFRRIGSMLTDSSAKWVKFFQHGNSFAWDVPTNDINSSTLGSTALITLNVPTGIQVTPITQGYIANAAQDVQVLLSSPEITTPAANTPSGNFTSTGPVAGHASSIASNNLYTNTSAQIRAVASASNTTLVLATSGWIDTRGQG